jgi:GNAT superfamily N-acetyltransferase
MEIIRLIDRPEMKELMADWFHEKWGISRDAYLYSMGQCLKDVSAVPGWYAAIEDTRIIGGVGVIENDFHDRKDLSPNVCALYVEPDFRGKGIAGALLNFVCEEMRKERIEPLYLITDHTSFYERYGWEFFCNVNEDGGGTARMYVHK